MKRTVLITLCIGIAISAFSYLWVTSSSPSPGRVDADKLAKAVDAYIRDIITRGIPVGETVSMQDLIDGGYLSREDVSGFDGMEVHIDVDADETRPQAKTVRVRMPDGHELTVRGDGSVQAVRK